MNHIGATNTLLHIFFHLHIFISSYLHIIFPMLIRDITSYLETIAPPYLQEDYDNCGLLTGKASTPIQKILVTLDVTEAVLDEAISLGCNLVVAHHPLIFKGIKKLSGNGYVERCIIKAIRNDIAIYAIHTNLDNVLHGVSGKIAQMLGLEQVRILHPKASTLQKLVTYIPKKDADQVMAEVHAAGAGQIGHYSECSFRIDGIGTFKPDNQANPHIGTAGNLERVEEVRAEVIFPAYLKNKIIQTLIQAHPYEQPAYDIYALENTHPESGSGVVGELPQALSASEFLNHLKNSMKLNVIRHTALPSENIKRVAICGGSGSFLLKNAISLGADVYVSADFKYHEFFDADGRIMIADIGHYESEVYTKDLIAQVLTQKFSNIATLISEINTNPISYL
jgi:dinuclear metal center YbgI/SA1388 family protein